MSQVDSEHVLVVPTAVFQRLGYFQGFNSRVADYLDELLKPAHVSYRPRRQMEADPSFKQLIPYCIFQHRDAAERLHVLHYVRGSGQGEGRLHRKRSVGIGGHISAHDALPGASSYEQGMHRELEEEVSIDTPYVQRCVGLINDDQTEVGRVHLGVVHLFEVERTEVRPRECDLLECGFCPVDELLADLAGFESWSAICLEALFGQSSQIAAADVGKRAAPQTS
ncbi:MAG: NUDIX domain-containing protein [Pirellulales bacterium]